MILDDERESRWRIVFKDNDRGIYAKKSLLYANIWDLYRSDKHQLSKGGYYVEVLLMWSRK